MGLSVTVLLSHYGDPWWIYSSIVRNKLLSNPSVSKIVVIDNAGNLANHKFFLTSTKIELIPFRKHPPNRVQHAFFLNNFVRERKIDSDFLLVLDTDVVPLRSNWIGYTIEIAAENSLLVFQEWSSCLTHSCFMLLSKGALERNVIDFERGISRLKFDTGRLVGLTLEENGINYSVIPPKAFFKGLLGYQYLETFLHITSVSVRQMPSRKFNKRIFLARLRNNLLKQIAIQSSHLPRFDSRIGFLLLFLLSLLPPYKRFNYKFFESQNSEMESTT